MRLTLSSVTLSKLKCSYFHGKVGIRGKAVRLTLSSVTLSKLMCSYFHG